MTLSPLAAERFNDIIKFFELSLRVSGTKRKTIDVYVPAARKIAARLAQHRPQVTDWSEVDSPNQPRGSSSSDRSRLTPYARSASGNWFRRSPLKE